MIKNAYIIILILIIIFLYTYNLNEFFITNNSIPNKIIFNLKTNNGLNLIYYNNNFYITNQTSYTFIGILSNNGLYKLQDTLGYNNLVLDYNINNPSDSKIILESPQQDNPNQNNINNLFSMRNKNIYLDPINKLILSNDNYGNIVYLYNNNINTSITWNFNLDIATIFNINYN
jgi:hypothetical protein